MGSAIKHVSSTRSRVPIKAAQTRKHRSPIDKAKGYEVVWPQVSAIFEAARRFDDTAVFVYLVGEPDDGALKIGTSKDPIGRLRTMQTGNPRRLKIEYVLLGGANLEKLLHEFWEPDAIRSARASGRVDAAPGTEWFNPQVRERLIPIIAAIAERQVEFLNEHAGEDVSSEDMERIIRDVHAEHDFVPQGRDEVKLLAQGAGHVLLSRPSRL